MDTTYNIRVMESGSVFPCRENERVIEAMRRSGSGPITHGCYGGGCGVCKMKITSGDYRLVKKMSRAHISEAEEKEGIVLICCITPQSDLMISAQL